MKNQDKSTVTPIVYTYRYFWKKKDGQVCVKFVTDCLPAHDSFMKSIRESDDVVSCAREYMHEINFAFLGFTESVKEEKNEEKEI